MPTVRMASFSQGQAVGERATESKRIVDILFYLSCILILDAWSYF